MRSTNNREVNTRLVHITQNLVLNTIEIEILITNWKEKRLPNVVSTRFGCVVSNRTRRILSQDTLDGYRVVRVDPERQLTGSR